ADAEVEDDPSNSWLELILLCIGGGLFALAMPCTYPMIPITFSFFMKQAEKRGGNVLPLSIVYGLGIIAMFVFVGVALSQVIIPFVNHWATNAVIGVFFFFFAFVLFGWVNLNPPQWMNKIAMKSQQSAGGQGGGMASALAGVFFMGATLVITSFTCTAPIVGSLIARVAELGTARVAIGMAIFGATMAIPFMVLSLMPGKVKAMPKSGAWMDTLKISLGFVELAAAFKFVSMVDFAFGWQIMPRELFLMLWAAIFALWALFLFGILRKAGTPPEGATNGRMAMGMLVTLLAAYFMFGAMGNRLDPLMTSFAPSYSNAIVHAGAGGAGESKKHVIVYDDPDAAMERAREEDKLLLYNFTGFN
ncbi:MAG: cytochrome c biogenesis protein CcdA, partial [Planctomycetota bacterium]